MLGLEIRTAAGRRTDKVGRKREIEKMLIYGAHISMSHPTFKVLKLNKNKDDPVLHNQTRDEIITSLKTETCSFHPMLSPTKRTL